MHFVQKFLIFLFLVVIFSCTRDVVSEEPLVCDDTVDFAYDVQVKAIIDKTCAYTGCHVQGQSAGDYSSYEGIEPFLAKKFEARVIDNRDMPPSYATGPDSLTTEEFRIIRCWMQNGYLETP